MAKRLSKAIRFFIPLGIVTTGLAGTIYLTVQQNYRQNADDPQIQIAQDTVNSLNSGANPTNLVSSNKIDLTKSLSPFLTMSTVGS